MRGVIFSGLLMAAIGCATVGKVGVNTDTYQTWWQDCGVSRPVPGNIALFKGQLTSPHAALIAPEEMPPKTSNVRGVMRVVIPMADRCNGKGIMIAELTPDTDITPAAVPSKAKYKVTEIDPSRWGE